MFGNHDYGSAAVEPPWIFDPEEPEPTDAELDSLIDQIEQQAACPICDGRGQAYYGGSWMLCRTCHGTGICPTTREAG